MSECCKFASKVKEVIEEADANDDIKEQILENIDFEEIVRDVIEDEDVKDALNRKTKKFVMDEIENLDSEDIEDLADAISEQIKFEDVTKEILENNEQAQVTLRKKAEELILAFIDKMETDDVEKAIKENFDVSEVVARVMGDSQNIKDVLDEAIKDQICTIAKQGEIDFEDDITKAILENFNIDEMSKRVIEQLQEKETAENFIKNIAETVAENENLNQKIAERVLENIATRIADTINVRLSFEGN
ncbi:MAG: hypothetical protein ABIJ40_02540 [Bacteroidota bacterium]|nr:hypothetical protein [Elusimicrobiota bacterium]